MWVVFDGRKQTNSSPIAHFDAWDGESALAMVQASPEHLWLEFESPTDEFLEEVYNNVHVSRGLGATVIDVFLRGSFVSDGVYISDLIEALEELVVQERLTVRRDAEQKLLDLYTRFGSL